MQKKLLLFLFSLFVTSTNIIGQNIKIPITNFLSNVLSQKEPIQHFTLSEHPIIPVNSPYTNQKQQLLYNEKGLYVFIDGTGVIYKAQKWDTKEIEFSRIDSTTFLGYNISALKMMKNDTIYSFGGYGFWRFNGYLSFFHPTRNEWEIIPMNKEIPFWYDKSVLSSMSFIAPTHHKIYFTEVGMQHQGIKFNKQLNDTLYAVDLTKKYISTLGTLGLTLDEWNLVSLTRQVMTPHGLLLDNPFKEKNDYLLDFTNNRILSESESMMQKLVSSKNNEKQIIYYFRNGFIYSTLYPFEKVDSIKFNISNFKPTKLVLYHPIKNGTTFHLNRFTKPEYFIIAFLTIIVAYLIFRTKKTSASESYLNPDEKVKIELKENYLNSLEKELLKQFYSKVEKYGHCTVEDLNMMLGVSNKTIEIKKKARTDFITKVNFKIKSILQINFDVIERERAESDKRSYLYFIQKENTQLLKDLLKE